MTQEASLNLGLLKQHLQDGNTQFLTGVLELMPGLARCTLGAGRHRTTLLNLAARYGSNALIKLLLNPPYQIDVNSTECGRTALAEATYAHRTASVLLLLRHGADPNIAGGNGETPLCLALAPAENDILLLLLQAGADTERENKSGQTPIEEAMAQGRSSKACELARHGAHLRRLETAVVNNDKIAAEILGINNDVISAYRDKEGNHLLHFAVGKQADKLIHLLCEAMGEEADSPNLHGTRPLHLAVQSGNLKITKALLRHLMTSALSMPDQEGNTPLHLAAAAGNVDCCKLLRRLHEKYRINERPNNAGKYPRELAQLHPELISLWEDKVARQKALDKQLLDFLSGTVGKVHFYGVNKLLVAGANPNATEEKQGQSALHLAMRWNDIELVELLLKRGADAARQDKEGNTPFHTACKQPTRLARRILTLRDWRRRIDINARNSAGETPLDLLDDRGLVSHDELRKLGALYGTEVKAKATEAAKAAPQPAASPQHNPARPVPAAKPTPAAVEARKPETAPERPAPVETQPAPSPCPAKAEGEGMTTALHPNSEPGNPEDSGAAESPVPPPVSEQVEEVPAAAPEIERTVAPINECPDGPEVDEGDGMYSEHCEYPLSKTEIDRIAKGGLREVHKLMERVGAFYHRNRHISPPPLIRYALDSDYLPTRLYTEGKELLRGLQDGEPDDTGWALTLCLVRSFYENGKGNDPFREMNRLRPYLRWLDKQNSNPWTEQRRELVEARKRASGKKHNANPQWFRSQCPILKEEGEASELRMVNTLLWEDKHIHQLLRQDWDSLLTDEAPEKPQLPQELGEWKNSLPYINILWEHAWLDWLLMLKAMTTRHRQMPDDMPPRWAWLQGVAGIAVRLKNEMKWCYYPSRRTIEFSCSWDRGYGEYISIEGGKVHRRGVDGHAYTWWVPLPKLWETIAREKSGISVCLADAPEQGEPRAFEGQMPCNDCFVFRVDRLKHHGEGMGYYELLPEEGSRRPTNLLLAYPESMGKEPPRLALHGDSGDMCRKVADSRWNNHKMVFQRYELQYSGAEEPRTLFIEIGDAKHRWGKIDGKPRSGELNLADNRLIARRKNDKTRIQVIEGCAPALYDAFMVKQPLRNERISISEPDAETRKSVFLLDGEKAAPTSPISFRVNGNIQLLWLPGNWREQAQERDGEADWETADRRRCKPWTYMVEGREYTIEEPLQDTAWFVRTDDQVHALPLKLEYRNINTIRGLSIYAYSPDGALGEESSGLSANAIKIYYKNTLQALPKVFSCGQDGLRWESLCEMFKHIRLEPGSPIEVKGTRVQGEEVSLLVGTYYPDLPTLCLREGTLQLFAPDINRSDYYLRIREVREKQPTDKSLDDVAKHLDEGWVKCMDLCDDDKPGWYCFEIVDRCNPGNSPVSDKQWLRVEGDGLAPREFVLKHERELSEDFLPKVLQDALDLENGKPIIAQDEEGHLFIVSKKIRQRSSYSLNFYHESKLLTPWPRPLPDGEKPAPSMAIGLGKKKVGNVELRWESGNERLRIESLFSPDDKPGFYKIQLEEKGVANKPQEVWYRHRIEDAPSVVDRLCLSAEELRSIGRLGGRHLEKLSGKFCELFSIPEVWDDVQMRIIDLAAQEDGDEQDAPESSGHQEWRWKVGEDFLDPLKPTCDDQKFAPPPPKAAFGRGHKQKTQPEQPTKRLYIASVGEAGDVVVHNINYPGSWSSWDVVPEYTMLYPPVMYHGKRLGFIRKCRGERKLGANLTHIGVILGYKEKRDDSYREADVEICDEDENRSGELVFPIDDCWLHGEMQEVYTLIQLKAITLLGEQRPLPQTAWSRGTKGKEFGIDIAAYARQHSEFPYRVMLNRWADGYKVRFNYGYKFDNDSEPFIALKKLCGYPEHWSERFNAVLSYLADRCSSQLEPIPMNAAIQDRMAYLRPAKKEGVQAHLDGILMSVDVATKAEKRDSLRTELLPIAGDEDAPRDYVEAYLKALAIALILRNRKYYSELRLHEYSLVIRPLLMDMALTNPCVQSALNEYMNQYNDFFI